MRSFADVYSLHCNPTKQTDTLFSYKLDFEHSKGQVIGSPSYFLKRRYNPIEKTQVKKGLLLILWILMKKGIWFLDIADCGAPFRVCVVPRGEFTCSFKVCKAADRRQTWFWQNRNVLLKREFLWEYQLWNEDCRAENYVFIIITENYY